MKDRAKQAKEFIAALRELNTEGMVCDSVESCDGWQRGSPHLCICIPRFNFCAWCGKEINWDWERLKCGGNL